MNFIQPYHLVRRSTHAVNALTPALLGLLAALPSAHAATVIWGDTTGNTRGADSIDIQSVRSLATQVVSGETSVALGFYQTVSGNLSGAIGSSNSVSGSESYAFGSNNTVGMGDMSYAFGFYNTLNDAFSFAFGGGNTISVGDSAVFGLGITNSIAYSTMIGPSDTAKVTILSSGNVGIGLGNASPTEKLDVGGNIRLSGSLIKAGGGTVVLPTSGTLTLPAAGGSLVTTSGSQTITGATTIVGTTTMGGSTAATQLKIDSGTGNVGIGTASPSGKLNVSDNAQVFSNFDAYISTANYWERASLNMRRARGTAASPANVASGDWLGDISFTPWNNGFVKNAANVLAVVDGTPGATWTPAKLAFYTSDGTSDAAERMTIKGGGSVGIGTISPGAKLSVVGTVSGSQVGAHINNTATSGYSVLRLGTDSVATTGTALHDFGSTHTASGNSGAYQSDQTALSSFRPNGLSLHANANAPIKFFTAGYAAANERMRIAGDGNVGIGTGATAPAAKLDVNGTTRLAGDVTVKNNAVIRISAAGDIPMIANPVGTNPAN